MKIIEKIKKLFQTVDEIEHEDYVVIEYLRLKNKRQYGESLTDKEYKQYIKSRNIIVHITRCRTNNIYYKI